MASHLDALKKEVEMLRQLSYPSIVKYFLTDIAEAESGKTIGNKERQMLNVRHRDILTRWSWINYSIS